MISKILSILKKQKEKEKPHIVQERYDFLEDVCAEFLIQVNVEGDLSLVLMLEKVIWKLCHP